ncbi:zinc dependent phospholipase C family protein [Terriglobus aquaticus]|uniref:Zinc dependent phospholipase C family protein n=1 Tax=Terriglobus aquaticus TaxID=940139 RepID=A0ABW9KHC5_9BACT|nr:zinc dependent phospholipase C family protein [Terriglobus aquaticus]
MRKRLSLLLAACLLAATPAAHAYSVLTHEQLIDLTWDSSIVPLLRSRYPTLTAAQLQEARAYAYGGCVIQDIGYYPFGDEFFSDLTHYVRSGDFVVNLFRNAGNADELAFAVGALSHYVGDTVGHSEATNRSVPVEFPKLRALYGDSVNYAQGPSQHVRTEFAFDVNEIAHHRFAPVHYLRQIGLQVPTKQLALAFYQTYGLGEDFTQRRGRRINVSGYRFSVRSFLPRIAYAVTLLHRHKEPADVQDADFQRMERELQQVATNNHWDDYRKKAGIGTYCLAGLLYILPKVGPIKFVSVKGPTDQTEVEYVKSVIRATDALNRTLHRFTPPPTTVPSAATAAAADTHSTLPASMFRSLAPPQAQRDPNHPLANRDLDTGNVVQPAGYPLTDQTYARLLHRLTAMPNEPVPPGVKTEILNYFSNTSLAYSVKHKPQEWATVQKDLVTLQGMPTRDADKLFETYGDDNDRDN